MSKVARGKEIWVSCGLTLNLGNYESARLDAGISLPVKEEDSPDKMFKEGWNKVLKEIEKQAIELKQEKSK